MSLETGKRLHRAAATWLPMPAEVLSRVALLSQSRSTMDGLEFLDRNQNPILDLLSNGYLSESDGGDDEDSDEANDGNGDNAPNDGVGPAQVSEEFDSGGPDDDNKESEDESAQPSDDDAPNGDTNSHGSDRDDVDASDASTNVPGDAGRHPDGSDVCTDIPEDAELQSAFFAAEPTGADEDAERQGSFLNDLSTQATDYSSENSGVLAEAWRRAYYSSENSGVLADGDSYPSENAGVSTDSVKNVGVPTDSVGDTGVPTDADPFCPGLMRQIADHLGPGRKQDASMILQQGRYILRSTTPASAAQAGGDDLSLCHCCSGHCAIRCRTN